MTSIFDLVSTMSHSPKLEILKAADFEHFGATWWPRARYERLRTVTFLAVWVGIPPFSSGIYKLTKLHFLVVRLGRR